MGNGGNKGYCFRDKLYINVSLERFVAVKRNTVSHKVGIPVPNFFPNPYGLSTVHKQVDVALYSFLNDIPVGTFEVRNPKELRRS